MTTNRVKQYADKFIVEVNKQLIKDCDPDDSDMLKAIQKHIRNARSSKGKKSLITEAEHMAPIENKDLDKDIYLFNTPNGILDLKTGELVKHDSSRLMSKVSYTEYTDKVDCPLWEQFLDTVFNRDKELIKFIQKAVGYSLTGSTSEQVAFFLYGTGGNGKGVFVETIAHIAGTYAANIQAESLMVKGSAASGQPNSDIARLAGARFVTSSESNEGGDRFIILEFAKQSNDDEFYKQCERIIELQTNADLIKDTDYKMCRLSAKTEALKDDN